MYGDIRAIRSALESIAKSLAKIAEEVGKP